MLRGNPSPKLYERSSETWSTTVQIVLLVWILPLPWFLGTLFSVCQGTCADVEKFFLRSTFFSSYDHFFVVVISGGPRLSQWFQRDELSRLVFLFDPVYGDCKNIFLHKGQRKRCTNNVDQISTIAFLIPPK